MGTADAFVAEARKSLGTREQPPGSNHNYITVWYNDNVDRIGNGAWCDMAVTMWGAKSGNADVVGKFAYTVWHAQWFEKRGQWHSGTRGVRKGDVVFFDWGGSRSISRIDHVGIVEKVSGSIVYTIEGNSGDVCRRVARDSRYIVGYGRPAFKGGSSASSSPWTDLPLLKKGARGEHVQTLQGLLVARSHPEIEIDGVFDTEVEKAVRALQKWGKVTVDGEVGQQTWPLALRLVGGVRELPLLKKGSRGEHVQTLQGLLRARSHPEIEVDGVFDDEVEKAVKALQKWGKVDVDGEVGKQTWPVALRVHK